MSGADTSLRFVMGTLVLGVLFATIWSLSFVATKTALGDIPPLALAAIRLLFAGLLLAAFKARQVRDFAATCTGKGMRKIVIAGLLSQALYLCGSYWALVNMPTSVVNIVVSTLPLVTLPFAFALLGEKAQISSVFAFFLGIAGVGMTLAGGGSADTATLHSYAVPAGVLFASVLALALGNVLIKPLVCTANLVPICAIQFLSSGLMAVGASWALEPTVTPAGVASGLQYILFLSLIGSILGTLIWFRLLDRMPAGAASSFFLLTPIFGVFFGWVFFGEPVTTSKFVGVLIICSAITLRTGMFSPSTFFSIRGGGFRRRNCNKL